MSVQTESGSDDQQDHETECDKGDGYLEVESVKGVIPLLLICNWVLPRLTAWFDKGA